MSAAQQSISPAQLQDKSKHKSKQYKSLYKSPARLYWTQSNGSFEVGVGVVVGVGVRGGASVVAGVGVEVGADVGFYTKNFLPPADAANQETRRGSQTRSAHN